jgi:hypothetical protein
MAALISKPSVLNAINEKFALDTTVEMQAIVINFLRVAIIDRYTSVITISSVILGLSFIALMSVIFLHRKKHE